MIQIYKKFTAAKQEVSKMTEAELNDTAKKYSINLPDLGGFAKNEQDQNQGMVINIGRCSRIACIDSCIETKKPAKKTVA